mgnify:CR=1 FL=1
MDESLRLDFTLTAQNANGGWGFQPGAPSDPDSTGAALQAQLFFLLKMCGQHRLPMSLNALNGDRNDGRLILAGRASRIACHYQ